MFVFSAYIRKPYEAEGFTMSDATYHVLLTMQAYDETPCLIHKWLPIQTFGDQCNKHIENGPSLLQDEYGNSYYVSFSPMGFYFPYFFCKILHLGLTVRSLYIFNCLLMMLSAILTGYIMYLLFKDMLFFYLSMIAYMFIPEVLYSQGIVYWHHSLSQVFLLLQIVFFILLFVIKQKNNWLYVLFFIIAFLYPYLEWSGFISNIGIAFGILMIDLAIAPDKQGVKRISISMLSLIRSIFLLILTIGAFGYYIFRFSNIAPVNQVVSMMFSRAGARSNASITVLLQGYRNSFYPLLIGELIFFLIILMIKKARKKFVDFFKNKNIWIMIFVFTFPLLENLIMKEHAISYTFDRLKGSSLLIFLFCICIYTFCQVINKSYILVEIILSMFVLVGLGTYDDGKVFKLDEYNDTIAMKTYLQEKYLGNERNIIVKSGWRAWGFLQTLYHRNVYCTALYSDKIEEIANSKSSDYIITLESTSGYGDTSCYTKATVEEIGTSKYYRLIAKMGKVISEEIVNLYAADLTDANWTNGISNATTTEILFSNTRYNYSKLMGAKKLYHNGVEYEILSLNNDSNWIHVFVDKDATECCYPNALSVSQGR